MLKSYGLKKSLNDPRVFYDNDLSLIIAIYVDDFVVCCASFKMKDFDNAKSCIGLTFGMADCKSIATPSDMNQKLSVLMSPKKGLFFFYTSPKVPDIAFAVNDVSRFNSNYDKAIWIAV